MTISKIRPNPLKADPTRTGMLRISLERDINRRFRKLQREITKLLVTDDVFGLREPKGPEALNVFCPTGKGGGVDPTCSPGGMPRHVEVYRKEVLSAPEGTEVSVLTESDGTLIGRSEGLPGEESVGVFETPRLRDSKERLIQHHNHPIDVPPSQADLTQLANTPGISEIYAHSSKASYHVVVKTEDRRTLYFATRDAYGDARIKAIDRYLEATEESKPTREEFNFEQATEALGSLRDQGLISYRRIVAPVSNSLLSGNVFCPTGKGGGVDPTCSPGGGRKALKRREGFTYKDPLPLENLGPGVTGRTKGVDKKSLEIVADTLNKLNDKYGVPTGGIHVTAIGLGSAVANAGRGKMLPVSEEEAKRLHGQGEHILDFKVVGTDNKAQYWHDGKEGVTIGLQVKGPHGGKAGWFGESPSRFDKKYQGTGLIGLTRDSGEGTMRLVVTHEYGHALSYAAGYTREQLGGKGVPDIARRIGSSYAMKDFAETVAEAFAFREMGGSDPVVDKFLHDTLFSKLTRNVEKEESESPLPDDVIEDGPDLIEHGIGTASEEDFEGALNVFCPTGKGGGVDPTCSPKSKGLGVTATPEFKAWFGESKVVDADGKPLVVYHGTGSSPFDVFDPERTGQATDRGFLGRGVYMTDKRETAEWYAMHGGLESRVYPVYVRMENPLLLESNDYTTKTQAVVEALDLSGVEDSKQITGALKRKGYDGVVYHIPKSHATEYMVPDSVQIKSAAGNRGTFDPDDPIITHSASPPTTNTIWRFLTRDEQLTEFMNWLKSIIATTILAKSVSLGRTDPDHWLTQHIERTFRKGMERAFDVVKYPQLRDKLDFFQGTKEEFLRQSFNRPVSIDRVKLLASRAFNELSGVTDTMATQMQRTLTDGFIKGESPWTIARELNRDVAGLGIKRAKTIARTEVVRAHNEGQLDGLEDLGVTEVGVAVEWSTSGLGVTARGYPSPCPICAPLKRMVVTTKEAHGMLPRHPSCFISPKVKIHTADGWMPINHVREGDLVLTHKGRFKRVLEVHRAYSDWERVTSLSLKVVRSGTHGTITITDLHPVMIRGKWIDARDVTAGDVVTCLCSRCKVCSAPILFDRKYCSRKCQSEDSDYAKLIDGLVNCSGDYKFADFELSSVEHSVRNHVRLYNLSVEGDESYIAKGFVVHNCMCSWIPANVGEDQKGQKRTRERINKAIGKSILAERPMKSKRTLAEQRKLSRWVGSGKRISRSRPER